MFFSELMPASNHTQFVAPLVICEVDARPYFNLKEIDGSTIIKIPETASVDTKQSAETTIFTKQIW